MGPSEHLDWIEGSIEIKTYLADARSEEADELAQAIWYTYFDICTYSP